MLDALNLSRLLSVLSRVVSHVRVATSARFADPSCIISCAHTYVCTLVWLGSPAQMWQHETFIHFGYITVDIIGCVDGKYEHNSAEATCQDFAKILLPFLPPSLITLSLFRTLSASHPSRNGSHDHRRLVLSLCVLPLPLQPSRPFSNTTLSDDVISYRVLYISQHISGGRLRFGRHFGWRWRIFREKPRRTREW